MSDDAEQNEADEPPREYPSREIVEATLADINARITSLRDRKESLLAEVAEIEQQFAKAVGRHLYWTSYLNPQPKKRQRRLPNGEPLRRLHEYYDQNPGKGFVCSELARVLGMDLSTVYNTMAREGSGFTRQEFDVWTKVVPEGASSGAQQGGRETAATAEAGQEAPAPPGAADRGENEAGP